MSDESCEWFLTPSNIGRLMAPWFGLPKVPIIELQESHRTAIVTHLQSLDAHDRRMRFSHMLNDAGILRYVEGLEFNGRDILFGLFGKQGTLAGLVHVGLLNTHAHPQQLKGAELLKN